MALNPVKVAGLAITVASWLWARDVGRSDVLNLVLV
jgi:hypothetical protein